MPAAEKQALIASALLAVVVVALSGCGVVQDTVDGMTEPSATSQPSRPSPPRPEETDGLTVTITVESDAETSGELTVDVDSPGGGQSLRTKSVPLPFKREYTVATDSMFPLRATHVEVVADPAASYIECSISTGGQVVASHRAEGSSATATCDRSLRLGAS